MQQQSTNSNEFLLALNQNTKQLERLGDQFDRLNERSRDFATRSDLDVLRKELVARDALEPQLSGLKELIERVDIARSEDRRILNGRIDTIAEEQMSRQDRLGIRVSQAVAIAGFGLALFEFLTHLKLTP